MNSNPLLNVLTEKFIAYQSIDNAHYKPAIDYSIQQAIESINSLSANPSSFSLSSFEKSTDLFDQLSTIFLDKLRTDCLNDTDLNQDDINNQINQFKSFIYSNPKLFDLFNTIDQSSLDKESSAAYKVHMRRFLESGMFLQSQEKTERLKAVNGELTQLIGEFEKNIIKDTDEYSLLVTNEADVKGMPESVIKTAAEKAKERGKEGEYIFTLDDPVYFEFMQYCPNRELRKTLYIAYNAKCLNTPHSNKVLFKRIIELRREKSQLLGFESYNQFVLSNRMARTEEEVNKFNQSIQEKVIPKVKRDYQELLSFAKTIDASMTQLEKWDISYYSEKLKKSIFGIDQEMIRKHFPLSKVLSVLFDLVKRMYDITIIKDETEHLYHTDVQVYQMIRNKATLSYFYMDLYPRKGKSGGGWVYPLKSRIINEIPIVGIIANNQRPMNNEEPYLTLSEVETIFHEMGHALHIALCTTKFKSINGLNVLWDFVELPSQLMENFIYQSNVLSQFGISSEMIEQIVKMKNFLVSILTLRHINFANLDLMIHSKYFTVICDIEKYIKDNTVDFINYPEGICSFVSFEHLFNATYDYSCGYYSYMWAEVYALDAFEEFKVSQDIRDTAKRFEETILSQGGSDDPVKLFEAFKGRKVSIEPFLEEKGLK